MNKDLLKFVTVFVVWIMGHIGHWTSRHTQLKAPYYNKPLLTLGMDLTEVYQAMQLACSSTGYTNTLRKTQWLR